MLTVAIHKDVGEYKPKIIGKLSARTLASIVGGLGAAAVAAAYLAIVLKVNIADNAWIFYVVTIPFWLSGFWQPEGMNFEDFLPVWLRHHLSTSRLAYLSTPNMIGYVKIMKGKEYTDEYRESTILNGIEAWCPRTGSIGEYD